MWRMVELFAFHATTEQNKFDQDLKNGVTKSKTALDDVFSQKFSGEQFPGYATAENASIFNQDSADSSAVILELFKGAGAWTDTGEEVEIPEGTPRVGNQKTFTVAKFAQSIKIPKEFFDDNKHQTYEKMVAEFARRARTTRDKNAFALFRNALTTATTADGVALISDSHTNLNGNTVDNKVTGALSESTLNTAIVQLYEMKSQDGEIDGFVPKVLLVPPALLKLAIEITASEYRSGTANNDLNYYASKFPGLMVATSPYLGAAASGSDTAWFLLGEGHSVNRYVREGVTTDLVPPQYSSNDVYVYKGRFREVVGAMSHEAIVGSSGS